MFYKIPTFVINLKKRNDRLISIRKEFEDKPEFSFRVIQAFEDRNGAVGLWNTIRYILNTFADNENDFLLLCEDDHHFTKYYSQRFFQSCIEQAQSRNADILLGGVSWFNQSMPINEYLFWVDTFSATQFVVIFKKFFNQILSADFNHNDTADYKISELTNRKFIIFPFISTQKEFGYSDTTFKNNQLGRVTSIFESSARRLSLLNKVERYYSAKEDYSQCKINYANISIPTYIINVGENTNQLKDLKKQFINKKEFDITIIQSSKNEIRLNGIGPVVHNIVNMAFENDEDVIIICEEGHQFTQDYSKEYLFDNMRIAYDWGMNLISGGTHKFGSAVPVSKNLMWVDYVSSAQFMILYKRIFKRILKCHNFKRITSSSFYNEITSNKMILYPYISIPLFSNINGGSCKENIDIDRFLKDSENRMRYLQDAFKRYR